MALSLDPEKFIDVGSRVLVLSRFRARGRDGMEVRLQLANLWTVRDGQIIRMDAFSDQAAALEAAGLSE
jgi:ketosteroid isomerase-like protein